MTDFAFSWARNNPEKFMAGLKDKINELQRSDLYSRQRIQLYHAGVDIIFRRKQIPYRKVSAIQWREIYRDPSADHRSPDA
jgi:hypothetical protein